MVAGFLWHHKETCNFRSRYRPEYIFEQKKNGPGYFDYYDYFATEFTKRGIAFFTYNRRGVDTTNTPSYEKIDREKFKKYLPVIEANDVTDIIKLLRKNRHVKNTKIILLGWSEGSIIAPMVAEKKKNRVSALFLAGYVNESMDSVIRWQFSGKSSMFILRKYFNTNGDLSITRKEYEAETPLAAAGRSKVLNNATFEQLDVNKDSLVNARDFGQLVSGNYKSVMDAYGRKDDEWIWKNYFRITTGWMQQHFSLEANKFRMLRVQIPTFIFHGDVDANCDVNGVYDIAKSFRENNKNNLQYFIFTDHDHNLNFSNWITKKEIPEGILKMFEMAVAF